MDRLADYDYELPTELIASHPAERRDQARLLVVHRDSGRIEHRSIADLPEYLRPGDALVLNEDEALAVAAASGLPAATPVMAARYLAAGRKVAVIVTMGASGAIAFQGEHGWLVPTLNLKPDSVVDTTGAGDAFVGVLAAAVWSGVVTFAIIAAYKAASRLRVSQEEEHDGLDLSAHGERAYDL